MCFVFDTWRPLQIASRVSAGSITSSTWPQPAAMYGSMFLRNSSASAILRSVALLALELVELLAAG